MIEILTIPTGFLAANCYLIFDPKSSKNDGILVDPGSEADMIGRRVRDMGVNPRAIHITHGHYDHVGAVASLAKAFDCPVLMNKADLELYSGQSEIIASFGGDLHDSFEFYSDCAEYRVTEDLSIKVVFTPGHSPGCVCLAIASKKALFTGDTLFKGTIGRTDLPGSSSSDMHDSLVRITREFPDYRVFPGHGPETTMESELASNPFLRRLR